MAELTEVDKNHINAQVENWVANEFAREQGDGRASTPLTEMLQNPLAAYKEKIANLPEADKQKLLQEQQATITKQLQEQMLAGATKGGNAQTIEKNLTQSKEPTEKETQVSTFTNLLNIASGFLGTVGQTVISVLTSMGVVGEMIGNLIDNRDPKIKNREKMAAGAASGIKVISFDNTNISADASTRYNIMNTLNASLEKPNDPIPEVKPAAAPAQAPAEQAAPANAEPAAAPAAPEAPKQAPAPAAPQAPQKAPVKIDIRRLAALAESDNGDNKLYIQEVPDDMKQYYADLLKKQPQVDGKVPEFIDLGNFSVQSTPVEGIPLASNGKQSQIS